MQLEAGRRALERPSYRLLFDHSQHDRFSADQFTAALEDIGLLVGARKRTVVGGDYVSGVAERLP